jgi:uncharacterized RDD family membrane protein YckC
VNPVTNPEEDDFIKRLLGDSADNVESTPVQKESAPPPPVPTPNTPPNTASPAVNIEELLRLTAQPAPLPPPPGFAQPSGNAFASSLANNFPPPPPPSDNSVPPSESAPPKSSTPKKDGYTFDRGYFYQVDETANTSVLLGPAKFTTRLFGAIIDLIIAGLIVFACRSFIEDMITNLFAADARRLLEQAEQVNNRAEAIRFFNQAQELLTSVAMISGLAETLIALLYYTLMVGLFGRTVGHLVMGIVIMQADGKKAGLAAGFLRALYGSLGTFTAIVAYPIMFQSIFGAAITGSTKSFEIFLYIAIALLIIQFIIGFGLWWMVKDDYKQGWHDKLAGTYAIKTKPIPPDPVY